MITPHITHLLCISILVFSQSSYATSTFDGEWFSPEFKYAFSVKGMEGIATISNSPNYKAGQVMLRIEKMSGASFTGKQLFTHGKFVPVTGKLTDKNHLLMKGGGFTWTMLRKPDFSIGKPTK